MKYNQVLRYLILIFIVLSSCKRSVPFLLIGRISSTDTNQYVIDNVVVRLREENSKKLYGSDTIHHGKFTLKTNVPFEGFYKLDFVGIKIYDRKLMKWIIGSPSIQIYVQKNENYFLNVENIQELFYPFKKIIFSSSPTQELLSKWRHINYHLYDSIMKIKSVWISKMETAEEANDQTLYRLYADSISFKLDSIKNESYFSLLKKFCLLHPNNILSSYILLNSGFLNDKYYVTMNDIYNALSNPVKHSAYGIKLKEKLDNIKRLAPGATVPKITGITPEGHKFKFDYSKYKFTMIDFWASWCGPCKKQFPQLKKLYEQYHSKGFAIIGVSFDNEKQRWIEAIRNDSLPWYQVCNLDHPAKAINAETFAIYQIPQNYFVDSTNKIIAKNIDKDSINKLISIYFKNTTK